MLMVQDQLTLLEIDQLYDSIDLDGNGSISFLEFVAAMIDPAEIDINHMHEVCANHHLVFLFCLHHYDSW